MLGFDYYDYFIANGDYYNRKVFSNKDTLFPEIHIDDYGVKKSMEFLEKQVSNDKPFFLFHCPQTPHMNGKLRWDAKETTKEKYEVGEMPVPKNQWDSLN